MNKEKILFLINEKQHFLYIAFCCIILLSFINKVVLTEKQKKKPEVNTSVDTFIPKGFVLIPIEVANPESLNDIIGDFGYVDLYADRSKSEDPMFKLLVKNIRLLKSPVDSTIIAVLSPESMVKQIVSVNKKFKITIKSKTNKSTELAHQNKPAKRIIFE